MLVTRSSQESDLPKEFLRQLFSRPQALAVAGGFLAVLTLTSLPRIPLLVIGAGCAAMSMTLSQRETKAKAVVAAKVQIEAVKNAQRVEDYLTIDPMELELGVGLIRLADRKRGGDLLDRIQSVRQNLASDMGIILPKVRVRDNMRLEQHQYRVKIADMAVAQGTIDLHVSDPISVITSHLSDIARKHSDELLTRDTVKHLLDELRQTSPATVDEIIPNVMKLGEVQQVLQLLLREDVPIRQLGPILETLGDFATRAKDAISLTECVRQRLARTICTRYRDANHQLRVVTLDPRLEERIRSGCEHNDEGLSIRLAPQEIENICGLLETELSKLTEAGHAPIVLASPPIRPALKHLTASYIPQLVVLSYNEITRDTKIVSVAIASDPDSEPFAVGYKKSA
jgi:flagellar biosynthesis protein FlhA